MSTTPPVPPTTPPATPGAPATPPAATPTPAANGNGTLISADRVQQMGEIKALSESLLERVLFARQHGVTFGGARNLYEVLGYDEVISNWDYAERYARGGIAARVVDVFPNATWRGEMTLTESEDPKDADTEFEKSWKLLDKRLQVQAKLLRADKLSLLSSFSVLLIGAPGELDQELPKAPKGQESLAYFSTFAGGGGRITNNRRSAANSTTWDADIVIHELDKDPKSPRFGLPLTYRLKRGDLVDAADTWRPIHWTRCIHLAEGCLYDDLYGFPALERIWNLLDDLEKVTGGGAEAFWLRANQGLQLDISKDMAIGDAEKAKEDLKKQAEEYKHQLTRWLRTRGVTVTPLGSDVANFSSPADAILTQIAGAKAIPKRILTGSEMGELASSQDRDNWRDQVDGRRKQYAAPYVVRPLIDRLIQYGYLPTPKAGPDTYFVQWPQTETLTEAEKTAGAKAWAETKTVEGQLFTNEEIREKWYGMDPLPPEVQEKLKPQMPPAMQPGAAPGAPGENAPAEREEEDEDDDEMRAAEAALVSEVARVLQNGTLAELQTLVEQVSGDNR